MVRQALLILGLLCAGPAAFGQEPASTEWFELKIRPVLAGVCFKCHGNEKSKGGLRVDSRAALLKGGSRGPAISFGSPEKSLLLQALRHDGAPEINMPPGGKVSESVVNDFAAWIKSGAVWPAKRVGDDFHTTRHWAFEPVRKPKPPPDPTGWAVSPLDCFIAAKLREHALHPAPPASPEALVRRLYFDLIGLPPTPDEVREFLADPSPQAYAKLVDRLLASPRYGERWGRYWMDVARYADTAGDNADYPIPEIYRYRDYIIDAFNKDKPYDQFVQEQLAGDILANQSTDAKYAERVVATGFLALSRRYATGPYELWHLTMEDAIETTGRAFLGLTMRCARCHDHKFDPITRADYYAFYGIFESTQFPWDGAEEFASMKKPRQHFVSLLLPEKASPWIKKHEERTRELEEAVKKNAKDKAAAAELSHLRHSNLPPDMPVAYAVSEGNPADAYIQVRGEVDQHGPTVPRNVPQFLLCGKTFQIPKGSSGRLELARWLTRTDNPLTARVMVNRLWQHHFGKGIVATPSNFGTRGEPPTHPELLDWLAERFMESGWSIKQIQREIVRSKTYQMACSADERNLNADPSNRWYWRFSRQRLDAEAIRDALLSVSGNLDLSPGGPQPFPPIDQWTWTQHNPFKAVYPSNHRSVYLMTQRIQRHPVLALFDGADTNTTMEKRDSSIVPQQALFFMNDPFVTEQAQGLARRLIRCSPDTGARIAKAYELALARPVQPREVARDTRFINECRSELDKLHVSALEGEMAAWTSFARTLFACNEFIYLD